MDERNIHLGLDGLFCWTCERWLTDDEIQEAEHKKTS